MLLLTLGVSACDGALVSTGGETHFLVACGGDTGCGDGMSCICGTCTRSCSGPEDCPELSTVECVEPIETEGCLSAAPAAICEVRCTVDADCAELSQYHQCTAGTCRAVPASVVAEEAGGPNPSVNRELEATIGCPTDGINADQLAVIGDSFFGATHQITRDLEEIARMSGALAQDENYQDRSSIYMNALVVGGNGIAAQYASAAGEAEVRVVLMNGGGADLLIGTCPAPTPDCPVIRDATLAAEELLGRMAAEGVQHVVYAFYPDPLDASLKAKMDAFRPLIENVCENSLVPCHWLDLRDVFAGHYDQYVEPDGRNPNAAGAEATASAIWELLQAPCSAK